jgi:hypothetical protein
MIDVVNLKCQFLNCIKRSTFNYPNETKPLYCLKHKLLDMIDVCNPKCQFENCTKIPNFNYKNELIAIYCLQHKLENMTDIKNKKCISESCEVRSNKKYNNYCAPCFRKLFPNHKLTINYKVKENCIVGFIDQYFKEYKPIYDKRIKGGSSKRRPDIYIDCITHIVIIEIDEDQHKDYDSDDETNRSMQILEDLSNRVTIFIRFNPDNYTDKDGNKIKSCFEYNNDQKKLIISDQDALDNRLNTLRNYIEKHIKNTPDKTIDIINLYYNGF